NLKSRDQRSGDVTAVIRRLQRRTADVESVSLYMQAVQDLTIDTTISRAQYQFALQDANPDELAQWAPKLVERLNRLPAIEGAALDLQENGLSANVTIDRNTASRFGITLTTVDNALYDAFGQRIVSTIFTHTNQYRVILEADPSLHSSLEALSSIYLP